MSDIYDKILQTRPDLTSWLIHFTRADNELSPREVVRKILVEGVLRPGFAPRAGASTVYGPRPAVCFSEQPLGAFIEYVKARGKDDRVSRYGVLLHKHDAYVAGALPVIYGVENSRELQAGEPDYVAGRRFIDPSALPLREQYRYLAFNPTRKPDPIDWSHEREWRWGQENTFGGQEGLFYLGGICGNGRGAFAERVVAMVSRDDDITWLQNELRTAFQANQVGNLPFRTDDPYDFFWRKTLKKVKAISLETAERKLKGGDLRFARMEDWPDSDKFSLI